MLTNSSIGSFYAFILERTKRVRLTVVARSNYEAVKKDVGCLLRLERVNADEAGPQGLQIKSANHGDHVVHPAKGVKFPPLFGHSRLTVCAVVKTPAEAGETYDYIVCAHKAVDQASTAKQIAPAVDERKTCIVIIQNGVGNEDPFRQAFPKCAILSCVVR